MGWVLRSAGVGEELETWDFGTALCSMLCSTLCTPVYLELCIVNDGRIRHLSRHRAFSSVKHGSQKL